MSLFTEPWYPEDNELEHYGVLGMKWGVRRYQNADGTLTEAGKKARRKATDQYKQNARKASKAGERAMISQFGVVYWAKKNQSDQVSEHSRMAAEETRIQNYYLESGQKTLNRMLKSFGDSAFDDMDRGTMQRAKWLLRTDMDSMRAGEKPGYYTGEWLTKQLRDPRHKG